MHLHGHSFQIIDMGTRDQLNNGTTAFTNATHAPVIKDTVAIPNNGGFVRIRLKASNPGYWIFHSQFEIQMNSGMVAVVKVGDRDEMQTPPDEFPKCGNFIESFYGHATTVSALGFFKLFNICIFCCWYLF